MQAARLGTRRAGSVTRPLFVDKYCRTACCCYASLKALDQMGTAAVFPPRMRKHQPNGHWTQSNLLKELQSAESLIGIQKVPFSQV